MTSSTTIAAAQDQRAAGVPFHAVPAPVRVAFRLLERGAPELGARWAERVWFTLPRASSALVAGRPGPGPGKPFAVRVDGHEVVGEVWGEGPAVFLVHGWAGQRRQLAAFVRPLLANGQRVVAFDAPSHGGSGPGAFGPRSSSLPEFVAALSAVVCAHGPARAIIAHSMGATAAATAVCDGLPVERVVMLAPMASAAAYARRLVSMLGAGPRIYDRLIVRTERRIGAALRRFEVPQRGRSVATLPAFIVHDAMDEAIPVRDAHAIAAAWTGSRLRVTSGLGHRRLLRDPQVVADVAAFVAT